MKKVSKEELKEIVLSANSIADVCRSLDLVPAGDNYRRVRDLLDDNGIIWDKVIEPWNKGKSYKGKHYSKEDLISGCTDYKNINSLRKRLINEGLKPNHCEICGISGDEVSLELHHIDGNHSNNNLDNLQVLCPNCHSKTDNYRGRNSSVAYDNRMFRHEKPEDLFLTDEEVEQRNEERKLKRRKNPNEIKLHRLQDKVCPVCGKTYHPSSATQKYCSQECYQETKGKGARPSFVQLINDFKELKSFVQVGLKYNVTDNAVRKWCKLYSLPVHAKELKEYIETNFS